MNIIKKMKRLGLKLGFQKMVGYEAIFSCAFCEREPGRELYHSNFRKEKKFQNCKHNKQFNKNNFPQGPPQSHLPKTVIIKSEDADCNPWLLSVGTAHNYCTSAVEDLARLLPSVSKRALR